VKKLKAAFILVGASLLGGAIWFGLAPRVANNLLIEAAVAKPLEDGQLGHLSDDRKSRRSRQVVGRQQPKGQCFTL
jgi:hypothetical protein